MDTGIADRIVVITGASRGLGRHLAVAFAEAGARVGLLARDGLALKKLASNLPGTAIPVACDVSDPDAMVSAFATIEEQLGGIDSVVANAGVAPASGRAHRLEIDSWRATVEVNLTGSFLTARAAYPYLAASGRGGRLVLTSSVVARTPRPGMAAYTATKAGIEGLARALAAEWAREAITVNSVAPGFFDIGLGDAFASNERLRAQVLSRTPLARFGLADELANAVAYLAGDASGYVTGHVLALDGGYGLQ